MPKDKEFYQFWYVTVDNAICGASTPFQFNPPVENELLEVEDDDMIIVRTHGAVMEEKVRDVSTNEKL